MEPLSESIIADARLLELALAEGSDPNARGSRGKTPMHVAAKIGSVRAIELLLAHLALPDPVDETGSSPLMDAVGYDQVGTARKLLSAGVRMEYRFTPDPSSPAQIEIADLMARTMRAQKDNLPDWYASLSEDLVAELTSEEHFEGMIADMQRRNFEETDKNAIGECHSMEMLMMLVDEFGADLNHVDSCGYWPLKTFAEKDDLRAVKWLLERGARVDQTSTGETALFRAVGCGNFEMVRLLIAAGANVNQQDVDMCVPLYRCENVAMATLLLETGADPTITDQCGFPSWQFVKDPETRQFIQDAAKVNRQP